MSTTVIMKAIDTLSAAINDRLIVDKHGDPIELIFTRYGIFCTESLNTSLYNKTTPDNKIVMANFKTNIEILEDSERIEKDIEDALSRKEQITQELCNLEESLSSLRKRKRAVGINK